MDTDKKKINKGYLSIFLLLIIIFLFFYFKNKYEKNKEILLLPVTINLLTSVHPNLFWNFK